MAEGDFSLDPQCDHRTILNNTGELYVLLTGLRKPEIIKRGYTIYDSYEIIIEGISFYHFLRLVKGEKELVLKGSVDNRFNDGSRPFEVEIVENNFGVEELEGLCKIEISLD